MLLPTQYFDNIIKCWHKERGANNMRQFDQKYYNMTRLQKLPFLNVWPKNDDDEEQVQKEEQEKIGLKNQGIA